MIKASAYLEITPAKTIVSAALLLLSTTAYAQQTTTDTTSGFVIDNAQDGAVVQETVSNEAALTPVPTTPAERFAATMQAEFDLMGEEGLQFAQFYAARDFAPLWADGTNQKLYDLVTVFEHADEHGLPVARYNLDQIETLWSSAETPEEMAALELAAATAYVTYAKDIHSGMLDPTTIDKEMNATRYVPDTIDVLQDAGTATDLRAHYDTLYPQSAEYARLLELKAELEQLVSSEGWGPLVPNGRTLRPGNTDSRIPALRVRLSNRGYDVHDLGSDVYDEALVEVVKQFQGDFGLNQDGLAGPQTMAAVNAQPNGRLMQVIVNLERMRWMNYELGSRHVYVNIPDYHAALMDNGSATLKFRVVVGKNQHQTAEFSDMMTHMIANPTWHVPSSIASNEYYYKLLNDPTVLARSNIRMLYRGTGQVIDSTMVDYTQYSASNFPFVLQQRPGSGNALGKVKFMFPNKYNIYLHDTPSKSLFDRDARAYSHGCIRVQTPMEFAYALLAPQEIDPEGAFQAVLNTGRETQIDLETPIPVHIVYRTVFVDEFGVDQFRHDVYGRDDLVMNALMNAGVTLAGAEG